jgi:hypothetical protein
MFGRVRDPVGKKLKNGGAAATRPGTKAIPG